MIVSQHNIDQAQTALAAARERGHKDYVATIEAWLTVEERGFVWGEVTRYMYSDSDRMGFKAIVGMKDVAEKVAEFVSLQHGNMAHWLADGLQVLIEYDAHLRLSGSWRGGSDCGMTVQGLRDRIAEAQEEEREEVAEGWDGSVFWDDEYKAQAEAWISQTPYQVWKAVDDVEQWAMDEFRGSLFDMARDDNDGKSLARYVRERWEHHVKEWGKAWDKANKAA